MSRTSRGHALALRTSVLLTTAVLGAGCTGHPASTSSWQGAADRALGAAISGLSTARVALEVESGDLGPHTYTVVTVTDAIETSGKEVSSFQVSQPPDTLHVANEAVNRGLDDAVSLLVEIRVALASPGVDRAEAQRLVDRLDALRTKLDDLDSRVQKSPGSVGSS